LSRCQPDSACAVEVSAAIAAKETSAFRIIVPVPAGRRQRHDALSFSNSNSPSAGDLSCARPSSSERGRLVDAPDEALEPLRESAPLLFCQKAPDLASAAM